MNKKKKREKKIEKSTVYRILAATYFMYRNFRNPEAPKHRILFSYPSGYEIHHYSTITSKHGPASCMFGAEFFLN